LTSTGPLDEPAGLKVDQLRGFRIGVTSDRRSADLIAALQRRGAYVLHAPALKIAPNDSDEELIGETRAMIAARPDVVLITTGYGMRRWLEVADSAGLGAELSAVLEVARILARGPKSLGAVRAAGLENADVSAEDTTASMVDRIVDSGQRGSRIAVQLHGYTDEVQLQRLRRLDASLLTITPYRWIESSSNDRLAKLIEAACRRQLDAVTFTSAPAAEATLASAKRLGCFDEFCAALTRDVVAAVVGPVTAGPLLEVGVTPVQPERFRMGALIRLVSDHLQHNCVVRLRAGEVQLELRGRCVEVQGRSLLLGPNALALFNTLLRSEGVVSRRELINCLADGRDDHALEVAVSRLRQALGVPGLITTVVKRGYRLNAHRV
jgi:uroporphyrinogen-III synthase